MIEALTVAETAETLGIARTTVIKYLHRGRFPGAQKTDNLWRIPRESVSGFKPPRRRSPKPRNQLVVNGRRIDPDEIRANQEAIAKVVDACRAGRTQALVLDRSGNPIGRLKWRATKGKKKMSTTKPHSYADILTKELLAEWYEKFIVGQGRSMMWLGKKKNNSLIEVSDNTLAKYFRKYGFKIGRERKPASRVKSEVAKASSLAEPIKAPLPGEATQNGQPPPSVVEQLQAAWARVNALRQFADVDITGVTLDVRLRIENEASS